MLLLPLHRFHVEIGHAKVDDEFSMLTKNMQWRVELPNQFYGTLSPDAMLAMLRDDEPFRKRCHVVSYVQHEGAPKFIRLSRVALRPKLIPLLTEYYTLDKKSKLKEPLAHNILTIHKTISRVIFTNNDRTDCRAENLREIIPLDPTKNPSQT